MEAVKDLPQKVLMRHTGKPDNIPSNVQLQPWLPQSAVLAHPGVKLFVTHCGQHSLWEAMNHRVPVLGLPLAYDQHHNAAVIRAKGIGRTTNMHELTTELLRGHITQILNNHSYQANMNKYSVLFRDIGKRNAHDVLYWIEHTIHHGVGHLRSHAHYMDTTRYYMLDILGAFILSVFACTAISLAFLYKLVNFMYKWYPGDDLLMIFPMNYAHDSRLILLCCAYDATSLFVIQNYFTGNETAIALRRRQWSNPEETGVGLLPDRYNCGLRMRRECRERFYRHRL